MAFSVLLILVLTFVAAIYDIKTRQIPNWLSCGGILFVLGLLFFEKSWVGLLPHLMSLGMGVVLGVGFFAMGVMGGGDGKLFMLVSLAVPFAEWIYLVLTISVVGGIQALAWWTWYKTRKMQIPYAVSICLGTAIYALMKLT